MEISQDGTSYSGDLLSTIDVLRNMTEIFRRAYYSPTPGDVQVGTQEGILHPSLRPSPELRLSPEPGSALRPEPSHTLTPATLSHDSGALFAVLEKEMAAHCSILCLGNPMDREPGGLQALGSQRPSTHALSLALLPSPSRTSCRSSATCWLRRTGTSGRRRSWYACPPTVLRASPHLPTPQAGSGQALGFKS